MFSDGLSGDSTAKPIYDKPIYDDDIFNDIPGLENPNSSKFGDIFSSMSSNSIHGSAAMNDFLVDSEFKSSRNKRSIKNDKVIQDFEDLIPGFLGGSSKERKSTEYSASFPKPASQAATENSSKFVDPFESLKTNPSSGNTANYLKKSSNLNKHGNTKSDVFPEMGGFSDGTDPLDDLGRISSTYSRETTRIQERSSSRDGRSTKLEKNPFDSDMPQKTNVKNHGNPVRIHHESNETLFEMPPSVSNPPTRSTYEKSSYDIPNIPRNAFPSPEDFLDSLDGVWLTVSEIPLSTMPTSAPPPSRPPPSVPVQGAREGTNFINSSQFQNSTYFSSSKFSSVVEKNSPGYQVDIDRIFVENPPNDVAGRTVPVSTDPEGENSATTAMRDAMDRAEAKFRHAKIARERENVKVPRNREAEQFNDVTKEDAHEKVLLEKKEMLEREQQKLKEMEERGRAGKEQAHREAEEKEKEKARRAVERATREARDRAAIDALERAEKAAAEKENDEARVRAERAAVQRIQAEVRERAATEAKERADKAPEKATRERAPPEKENGEARARAERAAVQRIQAEARERLATEAKEKAEKAAEKATRERAAEARLRAERAAVERATSEARERAASGAREKAASEARERAAASEARERAGSEAQDRTPSDARERAAAGARTMNQSTNENDLDSFFSARSSSVPKTGASSVRTEFGFESQSQNRNVPETVRKSTTVASNMRKAPSAVNIVDDLTSIFGTVSSSFDFQEIGGESEERRMARLERHQKTQERAAKALAEKNERDLQNQRDQAERHRISETLDVEIKRWAAGKEANLRALLSTLQYVLWPDCGWQPLSLTDLINASSVKKAYRRATLCIHPDKVQQKGANLQQKYIAEKVFDLLKEAWNRFNSEELF